MGFLKVPYVLRYLWREIRLRRRQARARGKGRKGQEERMGQGAQVREMCAQGPVKRRVHVLSLGAGGSTCQVLTPNCTDCISSDFAVCRPLPRNAHQRHHQRWPGPSTSLQVVRGPL